LAVPQDGISVLHDLEFFVPAFLVQPHALAHDLQDVDDTKRPIALVCAERFHKNILDRQDNTEPFGISSLPDAIAVEEINCAMIRGAMGARRRLLMKARRCDAPKDD
jgi:hypothetical protein